MKGNDLFKDSFWALLGSVLGRGLALAAGIFVARFLGKDLYGEYGVVRNTIVTIAVFSTYGLGYTVTKYIADFKQRRPECLLLIHKYASCITLLFSSVMAVILFVLADQIAEKLLEDASLGFSMKLLAVLVVFNAYTALQIGILSGYGRFKELARINVIIGVISFLSSIVLTYFFLLEGALIALLITQILNCILNSLELSKEKRLAKQNTVKNDWDLLKELFHFSTPIALQEALYSAVMWINTILIVRYSSFGEVGLYTAAMQWYVIVLFVPGVLRNVILSHFSKNLDDHGQHQVILKRSLLINLVATIIPAIIIFFFSFVIDDAYGKSFEGLALLINISVITAVFTCVSNVLTHAYMSKGRNWFVFFSKFIRDVGILVLFIVVMSNFHIQASLALVSINLVCHLIYFLILNTTYFYSIKRQKL